MNDWTIIRRSLFARMFSTVTTTLTVAVAVALMLVLLTMKDAGRKAFDRGSGNMHLLISTDASPLVAVLNGIYYAGSPRRPIPYRQFEQIAGAYAPTSAGEGVPGFAIPVQIGDSFQGLPVLATSPEFFTRFEPVSGQPWRLAGGAFLKGPWDLVVGARAAASSGLKLGDTLHLTHGSGVSREGGKGEDTGEPAHVHAQFTFTVVGILEPTGSAHDRAVFVPIQASWLMHAFDRREREEHAAGGKEESHGEEPLPTEADLTDEDRKITGIYLRLPTRSGSDTPAALPQVFDRLRKDSTITVAQPAEEITKLFKIVDVVNQIVVAMATVVMVTSGISICVALYNSMEQRRRQIAILRVLGCPRGRVFGLVLTEAAVLGLLGAVAGTVLALGGSMVVAGVMKQRLGLLIDPGLSPSLTVVVAGAAVVLSALAGVLPAAMAYGTSVAKNLRPIA